MSTPLLILEVNNMAFMWSFRPKRPQKTREH